MSLETKSDTMPETQTKNIENKEEPVVIDSYEKNGSLYFTLNNCDVSIANSLRRIILSEIDTVVIKGFPHNESNIDITENTTKFNNEILKQRLSCIPIHIKNFDNVENYLLEIDVENNDGDKMKYVMTSHFRIKDKETEKYLPAEKVSQIFPPDKLTKQHILFARLRPKISEDIFGERLKLTATFSVSNASVSNAYNVVSTCAYGYTPDKGEQQVQWNKKLNNLLEEGKEEEYIEKYKLNWDNHDAKRITKENSFDFVVETVGVFTNNEIVVKGLQKLNDKFDNIIGNINNGRYSYKTGTTNMEHCIDLHLSNESYTTGKVIEYILYNDYYKKGEIINYIGFVKKHPHDNYSVLRIVFDSEENANNDVFGKIVVYACQKAQKMYAIIQEYFE